MPIKPISLETIPDLTDQINEAVEEMAQDLISRPMISDKRTVSITIHLWPVVETHQGQQRNHPSISYKVSTAKPGRKSIESKAFVRDVNGEMRLFMRTDDPYEEDPNQMLIPIPKQKEQVQNND